MNVVYRDTQGLVVATYTNCDTAADMAAFTREIVPDDAIPPIDPQYAPTPVPAETLEDKVKRIVNNTLTEQGVVPNGP